MSEKNKQVAFMMGNNQPLSFRKDERGAHPKNFWAGAAAYFPSKKQRCSGKSNVSLTFASYLVVVRDFIVGAHESLEGGCDL